MPEDDSNINRQYMLPAFLQWRLKRLRQYIKVRYKSWRRKEVVLEGIRIPLTKIISDNVREAMFAGGYEAGELRTVTQNLSDDDRVMEIGTGIGLMSSYVSKRIGSDRVFTYEANPALAPYIHQVHALNQVSPYLEICILAENDGEQEFFIHDDFWASSTLPGDSDRKSVKVRKKDINKEIERVKPTFLILDIEGGEKDLLSYTNLHGISKIALEVHTFALGEQGVQEVRALLTDAGFSVDDRFSTIIPGYKEELYFRRK